MKRIGVNRRARRAFTLVEMSVAMVASSIMFLAITGVLASNHKEWNQTYERVAGQVETDAYVTRQVFDRIVRQASAYSCYPTDTVSSAITLYLYTDVPTVLHPAMNRYARFALSGASLILEQGDLNSSLVCASPDSTQTLASHVTSAEFWRTGPCIHMSIVIDDGHTQLPVAMTATRHNP